MNEFILNNRSPWFITAEKYILGRVQSTRSCKNERPFTFELTNHNSCLRPGSKSLRSVATRLLTCCQKRVFSIKYPTTKIIIKYRISDWIASFLHFSIKADEFQKLSMYPSFPLFILTLGKGASGIGKPKNWHKGAQPSFTLNTNSCFSGTRSFLRFKNLEISKNSVYIDVSDGCWRPNVLVTSLWC